MSACITTPLQDLRTDPGSRGKPRTVDDPPALVVREATERDADAIFDLICFKAEFDGCFSSVQATPRKLIAAMRGTSPYFRALLAEAGGKPIGFASFHQTFSSFLAQPGIWLDDLFVRESHRGTGVGNALMRHLAVLAGKSGCARIDWIVATSNIKACDFYTHIGSHVNEGVRHCRLDGDGMARLVKDMAEGAVSKGLMPASQHEPQAGRRTLVRRSTAVPD
jgi:GNAT superfamily N-acetyltransferase